MRVVFIGAVVLVMLIWAGYTYRRLAVAPEASRPVRWLVLLVLVLGWGSFWWAMTNRDEQPVHWLNWIGLTWFAFAFYLVLALIGIAVLGLLARLVRGRRAVLRVGTPIAVLAALGVTGYGLWEADQVRVNEATVTDPRLPASADGLRIAVVGDVHVGPIRDQRFTRRVVDLVNAADPDYVVLTGDLTDGRRSVIRGVLAPLADLEAPAYAVTGNHEFISGDAGDWVDEWRRLGLKPVNNTSDRLPEGITVAGVHDEQGEGAMAPDYERALADVDRDDWTLFVVHEPDQADGAQGRGVDLQISGHTHCGQMWPFRYVVNVEQGTLHGLDRIGDVRTWTTCGAGAWGPAVRVLARPEVPVITLRRGS